MPTSIDQSEAEKMELKCANQPIVVVGNLKDSGSLIGYRSENFFGEFFILAVLANSRPCIIFRDFELNHNFNLTKSCLFSTSHKS